MTLKKTFRQYGIQIIFGQKLWGKEKARKDLAFQGKEASWRQALTVTLANSFCSWTKTYRLRLLMSGKGFNLREADLNLGLYRVSRCNMNVSKWNALCSDGNTITSVLEQFRLDVFPSMKVSCLQILNGSKGKLYLFFIYFCSVWLQTNMSLTLWLMKVQIINKKTWMDVSLLYVYFTWTSTLTAVWQPSKHWRLCLKIALKIKNTIIWIDFNFESFKFKVNIADWERSCISYLKEWMNT